MVGFRWWWEEAVHNGEVRAVFLFVCQGAVYPRCSVASETQITGFAQVFKRHKSFLLLVTSLVHPAYKKNKKNNKLKQFGTDCMRQVVLRMRG